ncbi:MAG TPA: hypothetical protein VFH06_00585 [Candidatus Saccharimonadales bacterium]|nr:hypothetical protein [Candidatus Saccharimonadales bacterium]
MARYVCHKCGGRDPFCIICWGKRYYAPKEKADQKIEEIPAQRTGPSEDLGTPSTDTERTESTDACT